MRTASLAELEAQFAAMPPEVVREGIEKRMQESLEVMLHAFQTEPTDDRANAVRDVGLCAVALDKLDPPAEKPRPFAAPSWLNRARASIIEFVGDDPEKKILTRTAFFWQGHDRHQYMNVFIFSEMRQPSSRSYNGKTYGAAVLAGLVTIDRVKPKED